MKRSYHNSRHDPLATADEPRLDISSLIDVCFLLLIYFLVTTTIQPREMDLKMRLPVPGQPSPIVQSPMLIELREGGQVVVNPGDEAEVLENNVDQRALPVLKERLSMLRGLGAQNTPQVLLKVDDEVEQQRYIDVINCLASAGIANIALQD